MESRTNNQAQQKWKKMDSEETKAAIHEEMKRMDQLPPNSTYATHRRRVLNKILQLIPIQVNNHENNENRITRCGVGVAIFWALSVNQVSESEIVGTIYKRENMLALRRFVKYGGLICCGKIT